MIKEELEEWCVNIAKRLEESHKVHVTNYDYIIGINNRRFGITTDGAIILNKRVIGKATNQEEAFKIINDYYIKLITIHTEKKIKKALDKADLGPYLIKVIENVLQSDPSVRKIKITDDQNPYFSGLTNDLSASKKLVHCITFYCGDYLIRVHVTGNNFAVNIESIVYRLKCDLNMQNPNFDPDKIITLKIKKIIEIIKKQSNGFGDKLEEAMKG